MIQAIILLNFCGHFIYTESNLQRNVHVGRDTVDISTYVMKHLGKSNAKRRMFDVPLDWDVIGHYNDKNKGRELNYIYIPGLLYEPLELGIIEKTFPSAYRQGTYFAK